MSRCWAVRERSGRVVRRGAAPTPPDLGCLFILLRSPRAHSLRWRPTPPRHTWALVGCWPIKGWGSQDWDIPLSPAPVVPEHLQRCGLHPATRPCSSAPRSVPRGVWHPLRCRDKPEPWGDVVASAGGRGSPVWQVQICPWHFGEHHSYPRLDGCPWPHCHLQLPSPSHPHGFPRLQGGSWLSRDKGCAVPVPWPAFFSATTH